MRLNASETASRCSLALVFRETNFLLLVDFEHASGFSIKYSEGTPLSSGGRRSVTSRSLDIESEYSVTDSVLECSVLDSRSSSKNF